MWSFAIQLSCILFSPSSLYLMMAQNIGFFVHANCNSYGGKMHPIEVAFADVHTLEVLIKTVNNTAKWTRSSDEKLNKYCSRRVHRLPHNFQGRFSWVCVINWLKEECRRRDSGLNLLVAVRGAQQKKIFQKINLPIVVLKKGFQYDLPPYERLPSYGEWTWTMTTGGFRAPTGAVVELPTLTRDAYMRDRKKKSR
ncbi:hypothetical protein AVEN_250504-1 [Araneus ventricosus]|uniref:Uncharacterized protein n=1 Tax=Araneus ventricosus TaxID=182803 RepID=A0A4Y2FEQ5_ARAVE|nr:hypothetical protein AVEN_250504-1 [Araneus ventricosus]